MGFTPEESVGSFRVPSCTVFQLLGFWGRKRPQNMTARHMHLFLWHSDVVPLRDRVSLNQNLVDFLRQRIFL